MSKVKIPRYETGAIGLPKNGRAITVSNTERRKLACSRQWWFSEVERLKTESSAPMRRGTAWHDLLEDVHRWWMHHDEAFPLEGAEHCSWCSEVCSAETGHPVTAEPRDCERCKGSRVGAVRRYREGLSGASTTDGVALLSPEEVEAEVAKLSAMAEGWFETYGREPSQSYRVVGVEVAIARPILNPKTGRVYRPQSFVITEADGSERLAGTGEVSGAVPLPDGATCRSSRLPWYQIGRLDGVLQHRRTGVLYVGEWKSSANPHGLVDGLALDPQTDGYCWLLEHAVSLGALGSPGDEVVGYIYDVCSTANQSDPHPLKAAKVKSLDADGEPYKVKGRWAYEHDSNGDPIERSPGFSRAAATIPSWRWRRALSGSVYSESEYREEIDRALQTTDPKLYVREWGVSGEEARARYGEEMFAVASRISGFRRAAARAASTEDLNVAFPRNPICRSPGGYCSFRAPCLLDGEDARAGFVTSPGISWKTETV